MSVEQLIEAVNGFAHRYSVDWNEWLNTPSDSRPRAFGKILRKWQATRPNPMRRVRTEAEHGPPFLEDLLEEASDQLLVLGRISLRNINTVNNAQINALNQLWRIFLRLPYRGQASCVGISKAILLMTDGRIGPAFDSTVRERLSIDRIKTPDQWITILQEIRNDLVEFERNNQIKITDVVHGIAVGRVYDMVLGPREGMTSQETALR